MIELALVLYNSHAMSSQKNWQCGKLRIRIGMSTLGLRCGCPDLFLFWLDWEKSSETLQQIPIFAYLTGLTLAEKVYRITDRLSKTLQTVDLTAADAQVLAKETVDDIRALRTDEEAGAMKSIVDRNAERLGTQNKYT